MVLSKALIVKWYSKVELEIDYGRMKYNTNQRELALRPTHFEKVNFTSRVFRKA